MIARIFSNKISNVNNLNCANNPYNSNSSFKPVFGSASDRFISSVKAPVEIKEGLNQVLTAISSPKFKKISVPILKPDKKVILENLFLKAKKLEDGHINLEFGYRNTDPEESAHILIQTSTDKELRESMSDKNFIPGIISKIKETSARLNEKLEAEY